MRDSDDDDDAKGKGEGNFKKGMKNILEGNRKGINIEVAVINSRATVRPRIGFYCFYFLVTNFFSIF